MRGYPATSLAVPALLLALVVAAALAADVAAGSPPDDGVAGSDATASAREADRGVLPDRYIVVYEETVSDVRGATEHRGRALGFQRRHLYRHGLKGFSAKLTPGQVHALRGDPAVDFVSEDRVVSATGEVEATAQVPLASGEGTPPTGVRRILAATETTAGRRSDAGVAVLDTGIDLDHPDLNAVHGKNCSADPSGDVDGHGTHVAGTIAARNDGAGVVGVAPATKLHDVKVLGDDGSGSWSDVICGVDWVTANASARGIGVVNMSLGGGGSRVRSCAETTDALHKAICDSTKAGINYVVAAGNSGWDFDHGQFPDVPAAYPQVLTVTATSDSDGKPGGTGGAPGCRPSEADDERASFSNYAKTTAGEAHTIAAPGVCIRSTVPGGKWATFSGTSMAAPHIAGIVALCENVAGSKGPCADLSPAGVIEHVRSQAEAYNAASPGYGYKGDPNDPISGRYYGFLTTYSAASQPAPAPSEPTETSSSSSTSSTSSSTSTSTSTSDSSPSEPSSSPATSPPPAAPPAESPPPRAVPVAVAIRRAVRSGRRLSLLASVDRRLAGERVELLVGAGSTLLGRAGLRVDARGRVRARGTLPRRAARARSLLVAIRTPATAELLRVTEIARAASRSPALRATAGGVRNASAASVRLTVSGRVRESLRSRVTLTVRYLDTEDRVRMARGTAQRLRDLWRASVQVPAGARDGVVTIATRGDTRHHGQGITARLPGG